MYLSICSRGCGFYAPRAWRQTSIVVSTVEELLCRRVLGLMVECRNSYLLELEIEDTVQHDQHERRSVQELVPTLCRCDLASGAAPEEVSPPTFSRRSGRALPLIAQFRAQMVENARLIPTLSWLYWDKCAGVCVFGRQTVQLAPVASRCQSAAHAQGMIWLPVRGDASLLVFTTRFNSKFV